MDDEVCPRCGGTPASVVYGFPGPDLSKEARRGEVVLGGCVILNGRPLSRCPSYLVGLGAVVDG